MTSTSKSCTPSRNDRRWELAARMIRGAGGNDDLALDVQVPRRIMGQGSRA